MSISRIVSTSKDGIGSTNPNTSSSINTTGATLIEVTVSHDAGSTVTISDSKSNTWNLIYTLTGAEKLSKFYAYTIGAGLTGSGHTFSVNGASAFCPLAVVAYSGTNLTYDSHSAGVSNNSTSTVSSGSLTPPASQALITSALAWNATATPTSLAVSGGGLAIQETQPWVSGQSYGLSVADEIQSSATARNAAWSWSGGGNGVTFEVSYYEAVVSPLAPRLVALESFDGFGGDTTQFARKWTRNSTTLSTSHPQAGTYGAGFASATGASRAIPFTGTKVVVGFWYYWDGSAVPAIHLCYFGSTGAAYDGFNGVCALDADASGQLLVKRGVNPGTTVATSSPCLNASANNLIQFYYDVQDSGTYLVYCNGVQVLSGSGDLNPGTNTLANVNFGCAVTIGWDSVFAFTTLGPDIIASSDLSVTMFRPSTGNGANTGLTPSTGTDHGALVDEAIANDDTDYNSGGAGVKDTYIFDASSLSGKTIYGVTLTMVVKATSAGTNTIAAVARVGGTDYDGTTQAITTSYAYYEQVWTVDPTGAAWTAGSLEFGMKSIASAAANRLTAVYLEVLHETVGVSTGAARLVGDMAIKTRLVGGVLA